MPESTARSPGVAVVAARDTATLARRLVERLGGRFSTELGIDVDRHRGWSTRSTSSPAGGR